MEFNFDPDVKPDFTKIDFEKAYVLIREVDRTDLVWHIQLEGKQPMCDHKSNLLGNVIEHKGLDVHSKEFCTKCANNTLSAFIVISKSISDDKLLILKERDQELRDFVKKNNIHIYKKEITLEIDQISRSTH